MRIDGREQHYIEAKRRLDLASGRLTSLDAQVVDVAGAMAYWRASWRRASDPDAAAALVLGQPWPDRNEIAAAFTEWRAAYHEAIAAWGLISAEAQLRLNEPTQPDRSALK